jgi:rhodanese-related sulfurtransferase
MLYRLLPLLLLTFLCTCAPAPENAAAQEAPPAYEDLTPAEFAEKIGAPNTVLLDVRTPGETAGGIIPGAIEMDFRAPDFAEQIKQLDSTKTYLVYCAAGGRSGQTCGMLNEAGFAKVYNLKGGYSAWNP